MKSSRKSNSIRNATKQNASAVVRVRTIPSLTRVQLFVRAGGRCEFDGCNEYLLEHRLTLTEGNFAEMAHIVAFRKAGPRGRSGKRPKDVHAIQNLMLLCPSDHKLIDDHPADYSRQTLEGYKSAHEDRIRHLTGLGPERKTAILLMKALIGGQTVTIPFGQVFEATSPRYPTTTNPVTIDLTGIPSDGGNAYYETACRTIKAHVDRLFAAEGEATRAGHVSVFALGPIPLLVCLGRALSNKVPSDLYQRHRDTETWTWKTTGRTLQYAVRQKKKSRSKRVALVVSLSGTIKLGDLPADVQDAATIYELTVSNATPSPTIFRKRQDLEAFRIALQKAISTIQKHHGTVKAIDLFTAVPAPVAVSLGRELLPKVHPNLKVFDYDKSMGGFKFALEM